MKFSVGDPVLLKVDQSSGPRALFLGYLLPFLLVTLTLVLAYTLTGDEPFSGLLSLFMLAPYYFVIYLFRDQLKDKFTFGIKSQIKV
jgi:sigma-E factor negative regulatory protein RseC